MDFVKVNVSNEKAQPEVQQSQPAKKRKKGFLDKLVKPLDYLLKALIYATIFAFPLVFTVQTYDILALPKQTFLGIAVLSCLAIWLIKILISRDFKMRRTPLDLPILIFGAIYLITSLVSISPIKSILGSYGRIDGSFLTVLFFIILYYLVVNNFRSKKEITGMILAVIISTLLVAILSFMQIFGIYILPSEVTKIKTFNPIGTLNALAVFIMAVIPITTALALRKKNESRLSFAGISLLFFILLIIINVRSAWLGLFAASIVLVVMPLLEKKTDKKWLILPAMIGLLSLALVFVTSPTTSNLPKETVLDYQNSIEQVKQAIKERPVFGSGPETYAYDFSKFRSAEMNNQENWSLRFDRAYSGILTSGATLGILGTVAYLLLIVISVITGIFNFRKATDEDTKYITLGATAVVTAVGVMSFFYFANFALMMVMWLSLALIGTARKSQEAAADDVEDINLNKASLEAKVFSTVFFVLLFCGSIYGIYYSGKVFAADITYRKALEKTDKVENLKEAEQLLTKAIKQNGNQEAYRLSLSRVLLVEANLENQKKEGEKDVKKIQDYLSQAIEQGKQAVNTNPNSVSNWEGMIIVYRNAALYATGAVDWIEKSYLEALKLEPTNPVLVNGLGQVYLTKNEVDKAAEYFNRALSLKSDYADPHYNLGLVYADKKEYDKSISEFETYLRFVPDSTEAKTQIETVKKLQANPNATTTSDDGLKGQPPATTGTSTSSQSSTTNN